MAKEKRQFLSVVQAFTRATYVILFPFKMAGDESGTTLGQPHLAKQDLNTLVSVRSTGFTAPYFNLGGCISLVS